MSEFAFTVASQLTPEADDIFKSAAPDVEFVSIARGVPIPPPGAQVLVALPIILPDADAEPSPPEGWPFDLRWTQIVTVGTDFYPRWFLDGPPIASGRGNSAQALAEFALAALFSAVKGLPGLWMTEASQWNYRQVAMLSGSTLGLVGFGAFGRALTPLAQALGMKVIAVRQSDRPMAAGVERAESLEALFAASDHVVLAAPATPQTKGIIDAKVVAAARPGLHLVNIARASLIEDRTLLDALDKGLITRATLDVTDPEPLPTGHPFYTHPRIFLSPHSATYTAENIQAIADSFAKNLGRFRRGEPLLEIINRTGTMI